MAIFVTDRISLAEDEIGEQFVRAPGPGGQNVNKLATAVQLRFDARGSPSLPDDVRARLLDLAGARATKDGEILIHAHRFRTRERNREDALERLVALVRRATVAEKTRKATRPSLASTRRQAEKKRRRAQVKRARRPPDQD
ncbi:MAG: aminoacyl-tRNA hydrolase [Acidobacteria bacterium]|nr:aminoacyl-tRNA hydrolase [Acidobacteriota bacterium]